MPGRLFAEIELKKLKQKIKINNQKNWSSVIVNNYNIRPS